MRHAGEQISAYLDGELRRDEVEALLAHLAVCGKCAADLHEVQQVRSAVRSLPMIELPASVVPEAERVVVPLRKNRGFIAGVAAAVVAAVIAVAAMVTPAPDAGVCGRSEQSLWCPRLARSCVRAGQGRCPGDLGALGMSRLLAVTVALLVIPATASASDLGDLLERGKSASYSAEQIITCSTPDGVKDAVVKLRQDGQGLHAAAPVPSDVEVTTGYGEWTLAHSGSVVSRAEVSASDGEPVNRYELDDGTAAAFLGRHATLYEMSEGDTLRARLIIDNQVGALLKVVTYTEDGTVYCERRFIAFDPTPPAIRFSSPTPDRVDADDDTDLPEEIAGFYRLDHYAEEGLSYTYYSDGFFSFAVFETDRRVDLGRESETTIADETYQREFTPGRVILAWETRDGGMALIGDLPPDMHQEVLADLPQPGRPGWWGRLWRGLFG